jgi:septal ring factor EnvC (AmiA/AmiB activator)
MQVDLSTVLGAFASVISVAVATWFAMARYAIAQREREIDRRLDDCRDESKKLNERLHTEEKATIRQDGDVNRVRDSHGTLAADIEEIKRTMGALDKTMNQIHLEMQRGRSGSGGSGGYVSATPKKLDPR